MVTYQYEWYTVDVQEATGRITWEIKARSRENAIKAINRQVKKYNRTIQNCRPDYTATVYWETMKLDRVGHNR